MNTSDRRFLDKMQRIISKAITYEQELTFNQDVVERMLRIIGDLEKKGESNANRKTDITFN